MGLVDYSSSDSETPASPPAKRVKPSPSPSSTGAQPQPYSPTSALPPLPPTFHDLYASTVRQSPTDDPNLHQGRRRQIPHVPGNWPSHIYIEWIPSPAQHALLSSFLSRLQSALAAPDAASALTGFLTSDLGAPLPLHVSLSRPFVLSTAEKDGFLRRATESLARARMLPFALTCEGGVQWHRTLESNRSFLVLRVRSSLGRSERARGWDQVVVSGQEEEDDGRRKKEGEKEEEDEEDDGVGSARHRGGGRNPELTALLRRCNAAVEAYGQPRLYEWVDDARVGDAFHVSIAWSFAEPDEELRERTADVFSGSEFGEAIRRMEFEVDGVKAKIGNVVSHIPLARDGGKRPRALFGV